MERVQFQQEQMLHELKDLVEKGLFTEVRIVKLRRKFFSRTGIERNQRNYEETNEL
jgi:hypothetical protein